MKKTFDAVAMKRRGSEAVYETVSEMTLEEEVAFWREKTEELRQLQAAWREQEQIRKAA